MAFDQAYMRRGSEEKSSRRESSSSNFCSGSSGFNLYHWMDESARHEADMSTGHLKRAVEPSRMVILDQSKKIGAVHSVGKKDILLTEM